MERVRKGRAWGRKEDDVTTNETFYFKSRVYGDDVQGRNRITYFMPSTAFFWVKKGRKESVGMFNMDVFLVWFGYEQMGEGVVGVQTWFSDFHSFPFLCFSFYVYVKLCTSFLGRGGEERSVKLVMT